MNGKEPSFNLEVTIFYGDFSGTEIRIDNQTQIEVSDIGCKCIKQYLSCYVKCPALNHKMLPSTVKENNCILSSI